MPQQTLHTQRLTLIPLADEHLEWEGALDSDPEVLRYLTGRASTRDEVEVIHARRLAAARKVDGLGFWVGLVDDDFRRLVDASARPWFPTSRTTRRWPISVTGCSTVMAQGLASEGARELVRYGFENVGLDRIIAQTMAVNTRLAGRHGADRPDLRADLSHLDDWAGGGFDEGEVGYELTRQQCERERSSRSE